jgi:hemerythrin-like metal-binding protein
MLARKGKEILRCLLANLVEYTAHHFAHEEMLMARSGYPQVRKHRRQHDYIRKQVTALQCRAAEGEVTMTIEVAQFLIAWLKQHTMACDRRIGQHLLAQAPHEAALLER